MQHTIYCANIFTSKSPLELTFFKQGYLVVDAQGTIVSLSKKDVRSKFPGAKFVDWSSRYIIPGLIDTHTHLPQYAFSGLGDSTLLSWLKTYTFPQEAKFSSKSHAELEAKHFFQSCLALGTTTVVAYVTSHKEATDVAFSVAEKVGMRAFLGQVLMDLNAPKGLLRKTKEAIADNESLVARWHGKAKGRLQFVVSPRFALSCSKQLLYAAGEFAKANKLLLQTHLSENRDEIAAVMWTHSWAKNYTDIYHQSGCLGKRTLLGHCIHLSPSELSVVKKTQSILVHCPTSNRFLASGSMPLRKYLNAGQRVSLGTDVAGGFSLSMFHEMKEACETSKSFEDALEISEAFYLATLGGAKSLGIDEKVGSFEIGKEADFVVLDADVCHPHGSNADSFNSPKEVLSRFFYKQTSEMVLATFVAGKKLFSRR